jgi:malonyl-CoA/methylmalonyl-CoA synthetase
MRWNMERSLSRGSRLVGYYLDKARAGNRRLCYDGHMSAAFLHLLQHSFARRGACPAVVHQEQSWTYAELEARVRNLAAIFADVGVAPGDRVALCTSNKPYFLVAHLATLYAGAVSLPLNPRFTRDELKFFLSDSAARLVVADSQAWSQTESLRPELPNLLRVVHEAAIFAPARSAYRRPEIAGDDPALMMYSSGTTGWPKGVVHAHGNLASGLLALQKCWRFRADDVVLNVLPLFHIHGLCFATLLTLFSGVRVILDDFEPQRTLERIGDCSVFMAVPTIYYRLLEQPNFRDAAKRWTKPRLFTCGSAPIRAEVLPELEAILGKPVINRYGMTEAFVITSLPLDGPWPNGSVGLPLEGVELRVVRGDDLIREGEAPAEPRAARDPGALAARQEPRPPTACLPGTVGAVQIRGPNLFHGYWNKPPRDPADWFDTGDLGVLDAAGFLTLVGRKNDLIITSGFNVYPQVVERVINGCPGVRESAVLGVPDDRKGERVVAVVVRTDPNLDEVRLRDFWSEPLVDYQRPRSVMFVEALPRNAMGKVVRRELQVLFEGEQQ